MMAAITAKQYNEKLNIAILERLDRVGKKIAITGNGRCNITNRFITPSRYHGKDVSFCEDIFKKFDLTKTEKFFNEIGILIVYENEKGYPASFQASSVTDALRFKCDELGIKTLCGQKVTEIKKQGELFSVITTEDKIKSKTVIAAAGMLSGGEKLGCDGSVFGIVKRMGHKTVPPTPSIVQLKTETDFVKQLKGIKVDARVTVLRNKKSVRSDFGEVLFCDYGLSGPPVLQVSGDAAENDVVSLDLAPQADFEQLFQLLSFRQKNLNLRKNDEFLSGLFNKRLGQVILKRAGLSVNDYVKDITQKDLEKICFVAKNFECVCKGNTGFINSQATKGGIATEEFFNDTLMSKRVKGLFACGEILDIDGDCGGFNLQWAWSSGFVAALGAAKFLERK